MDIQSVARDSYVIAAFLMTFDLAALGYSWKRLRAIIKTMPGDKRRIRFRLGSVSDRNEGLKSEYMLAQFIGCIFLAVSFVGALIGFIVMSDTVMIGTSGVYALDDFELAVVCVRVASSVLFLAMFCLSMVHAEDFIAVVRNEPSVVMTELEKLPKRVATGKAERNILSFSLVAYVIVIGVVAVLVPYNQWVKMGLCIVAGIIILAVGRLVHKAYSRSQKEEVVR